MIRPAVWGLTAVMLSRQETLASQLSLEDGAGGGEGGEKAVVKPDPPRSSEPARPGPALESAGGVDWGGEAEPDTHLLVGAGPGEWHCQLAGDCVGGGDKLRCSACRVRVHSGCQARLAAILPCKAAVHNIQFFRPPGREDATVSAAS